MLINKIGVQVITNKAAVTINMRQTIASGKSELLKLVLFLLQQLQRNECDCATVAIVSRVSENFGLFGFEKITRHIP